MQLVDSFWGIIVSTYCRHLLNDPTASTAKLIGGWATVGCNTSQARSMSLYWGGNKTQ